MRGEWSGSLLGKLLSPGWGFSVTKEPKRQRRQRQRRPVMTYLPSLAGSGTPRWTPGSRRREHSCISSGSQDQMCPSVRAKRGQWGEKWSEVSDSLRENRLLETLLLCKCPCCGTIKTRLYLPSGPQTEWTIKARRQGGQSLSLTSVRVDCNTHYVSVC